MYECMYLCMYLSMYVCVYVSAHIYIYTYIHGTSLGYYVINFLVYVNVHTMQSCMEALGNRA